MRKSHFFKFFAAVALAMGSFFAHAISVVPGGSDASAQIANIRNTDAAVRAALVPNGAPMQVISGMNKSCWLQFPQVSRLVNLGAASAVELVQDGGGMVRLVVTTSGVPLETSPMPLADGSNLFMRAKLCLMATAP